MRGLKELNRKQAKVYSYKLNDKYLKFIPMHHLGKKQFYDDATTKIKALKAQGYVIFFESINTNFTNDSLLKDTIRRKARKIKGFGGTYKDEASASMMKKYVQQPPNVNLGMDEKDLRADVDYLQLITKWEEVNGKIILDSMDLYTPFDKKFQKDVFYTKRQYNKIIIDYRNDNLLGLIQKSAQKKIVIVYGEGHRKNFRKKLKKLNKLNK